MAAAEASSRRTLAGLPSERSKDEGRRTLSPNKRAHQTVLGTIAFIGTPTSAACGALKGNGTTYSQALSMARAQAATRIARDGGPKSPRKKKVATELLADAAWYHPARSRLKEVDPRKVLQRNVQLLDSYMGKSKFTSSSTETTTHKVLENGLEKKLFYNLDVHSPILFDCGPSRVEKHAANDSESEEESQGENPGEEEPEDPSDDEMDATRRGGFFAGSGGTEVMASSAVEKLLRRGPLSDCDPKNHTTFLRDQVYGSRCSELNVKENSAVKYMLGRCLKTEVCYCGLSEVNFTNFAVGDRGLSGLLPLLTFGRRVRCLNLAGNNLRSSAVRQLCALLGDPLVLSTLLVVDLSNNPLGYECTDELLHFLRLRPQILMLGLYKSQLQPSWRQRLMKQSLANFAAADEAAMDQAMRYSERPGSFFDLDLRVRCEPIWQQAMSRPASPWAAGGRRSQSPSSEGRSSPGSQRSMRFPSASPTPSGPSPPPPPPIYEEDAEESEADVSGLPS